MLKRRTFASLPVLPLLPGLTPASAGAQAQAAPPTASVAAPAGAAGATPPTPTPTPTPLPQVAHGRIERLPLFASRHVAPRHVDIWLPQGYDGGRRHAVLYMHDGQMLFDASTTWNKQAWGVADIAAPLLAQGVLRDFIVVGPWNTGPTRHAEYFPQKFLPHLPDLVRSEFVQRGLRGKPLADAYLRFLVEELKPAVDQRYATNTGRDDTFLMGSSMGGLISMYGWLEYPQVFGGAAGLSTHWIAIGERNTVFADAALAYLRDKRPAPTGSRIYMDRGTTELDAQYDTSQPRIDAQFRELGFAAPGFDSRVFEGKGHNERDWNARLHLPLLFLLGKA